MVAMSQVLDSSQRQSFLLSYLNIDSSSKRKSKRFRGQPVKMTVCHSCDKHMRLLSELRGCVICEKMFCKMCLYPSLQLYLPSGTNLRGIVSMEMIIAHIKTEDSDEVIDAEVSEVYPVCTECESQVEGHLNVVTFNIKVMELESEMFDLQRQIDYALSFGPNMIELQV